MTEFNNSPEVEVKQSRQDSINGWENISLRLKEDVIARAEKKTIIVVECYQGVHYKEIREGLVRELKPALLIESSEALLPEEEVRDLTFPDVTDDRVFGYMTRLELQSFFDHGKVNRLQKKAEENVKGIVLILGTGASLIVPNPGILVYADMARWEIQVRMRQNEVSNLGLQNEEEAFEAQYKRGFFVDWRVCDRHKKKLMPQWNYVLDSNRREDPVMITARLFKRALSHVVSRPFSVVPYYDPGPWGGQWMKERFALDENAENYAWCFNCVPEENSLYLNLDGTLFETPAINIVFFETVNLLGDPVHARFGDEFPIRFDFLDTIDGGNLSLQVHPLTEYIREKFGMH
ncbi:MAG TPA: mannose-6-phosphate isomerase, partial [Bacteroidales bacterium]|nr:mannose-6-phosphate isomerase [Bacteroidales bacterium]